MELEKIIQQQDEIKENLDSLKYDQDVLAEFRQMVRNDIDAGKKIDKSDKLIQLLYEEYRLEKEMQIALEMVEQEKKKQEKKKKKVGLLEKIANFFQSLWNILRKDKKAESSHSEIKAEGEKEKNVPAKKKKAKISEYSARKVLSPELQKTGDMKRLQKSLQLLEKIKDKNANVYACLKNHLEGRLETAKKVQEYSKKNCKKVPKGFKVFRNGREISVHSPKDIQFTDRIILPDAQQPEAQSTINGCWSVSLQTQLNYRGMPFNQYQVRNFRPSFNADAKKADIDSLVHKLNGDHANQIYDMADLVQSTLPDTAHHHVAICAKPEILGGDGDVYARNEKGEVMSDEKGYAIVLKKDLSEDERQKIISENKKYFRDTVIKALVEHNSPVSLLRAGHYVTIVGIEGNELILKDPNEKISSETIDEVFRKAANREGMFEIDWLQDLEFDKVGNCTNIDPKWKKDQLVCDHGEFKPNGRQAHCSHTQGYEYSINNERNSIQEYIYVPKMSFEKRMELQRKKETQEQQKTLEQKEMPEQQNKQKPSEQKNRPGQQKDMQENAEKPANANTSKLPEEPAKADDAEVSKETFQIERTDSFTL